MRIITISREFGSGGRELGKRLAEALGVPCYDQQIIEMIAEKKKLDKSYVAHVSEKDIRVLYPSTIGKHIIAPNYIGHQSVQIMVEQKKLIEELATQGDCVIVGRCADLILKAYQPLNIFVYADQETKVTRCMERSDETENLSPEQLVRKMKEIDKNRASYRAMFTSDRWGSKEGYHLCVNTSGKGIKTLISGLTAYVNGWFGVQ
ncbi:cytidylate kinase-like family protein [Ligaoa zhengdingensis]|uniref:cytidylate kinase-like family protein n=1 Tax=Ligaoa zhengdingensis TaxID=2763658 RepID=UPI0031BBC3CA